MIKRISLAIIIILFSNILFAQFDFKTVAKESDFQATSRHEDVLQFIDKLKKASPYIVVENIATTNEGRDIPLLIIANPLPKTPADLVNDSRVVVYIQANIHSGEVEGKEASLMFVRDLLKDKNNYLFNDVILLVCPNLNADGNERISTQNRTNQNGPSGVGVRHNSLYLDLNRDAMKVESEEIRGVITNVLNRWDPSVIMDCHTTNGSYHQEPVTFTWIMNPNGDRSLINYMRDKMMPQVSTILKNKYNTLNCFYGEFINQNDYEQGWISYAAEPRYFSNYVGVRNRLGILNENYVYADYKSRVEGCYNLIQSLLDYSSKNKKEIKDLISLADQKMLTKGSNSAIADSFAITYKGQPTPEKVTILTYEAEPYTDQTGRERFRKTDIKKTVTVPYIADYYPVESIKYPYAYILGINDPKIIELLKIHGIQIEELKDSITLEVDQFEIEELKPVQRLNQGHYTNSLKGKYKKVKIHFEKGKYIIKTSQKLGNLAVYLLEPQTDDGLLLWNFFDRYLAPQWGRGYYAYPVYRINKPININTI